MSSICEKCGLPEELCTCETMVKEKEKIRVSLDRRRYGKFITVVEGISKDSDNKKVLKELKNRLACGGTMKGSVIELQGDHKSRVKAVLVKLGFTEDQIEMA
jgi:translation initiation factor 1